MSGNIQRLEGYAEFVAAQRATWQAPGCAVAIVKDGQVVYAQGSGLRDVANGRPVTPDTVFAIGSCTKAFTCTALGILADDGKLDWDRPVRDILPAFRLHDALASERATARDLVTHRTGLPGHDLLWYCSRFTRQELFDRLRHLEPSRDFRSAWQYNNLMYMAAGVLVEHIAGCSWEEFIQRRILQPLGMARSNFSVTVSQTLDDFAHPYHRERDAAEAGEVPFHNIDAIGPAGAINSCVSDMAQWLMLNLGKGKRGETQLISEAQLGRIHSPHMLVAGAPEDDLEIGQAAYGLGWMVSSYRGRVTAQHGGGIDGFASLVTLLPRDGIGVAVLTNLDGSPLGQIVTLNAVDRLLGLDEAPWSDRLKEREARRKEGLEKGEAPADSGRKAGTHPSHPLADYAGDYEHPGYGRVSITAEGNGDRLALAYNTLDLDLQHYHYDIFEGENKPLDLKIRISFITDEDGRVSSLTVPLEPSIKPAVFQRVVSAALTANRLL